jgi:ATP-dependent helicase/nuclease subunit B
MLNHFGIYSNEMKNEFKKKIFLRLIHGRNVLITRSTLVKDGPRQKYRYFDKIAENLKITNATWLRELLFSLKKIDKLEKIDPPHPCPELKLRPINFWASDLDYLINNPYVFYAKKILRLPEINHINELKNIRGNYIHKVLEEFLKNSNDKKSFVQLRSFAQKILESKWLIPADLGIWFFQLDEIFSFILCNMEEKKYYTEVCGSCSLRISDDCEVKISAKADRIDVNGGISIIDYKTGSLPSREQVRNGKKIQLPIESIIATRGGFELPSREVEHLCFWKLGISREKNKITHGGKIINIADNKTQVDQLNEKTLGILKNLIHRYNILEEVYEVNIHSPYSESYMHLARVKEWRI